MYDGQTGTVMQKNIVWVYLEFSIVEMDLVVEVG
jgi:hypothetical protein